MISTKHLATISGLVLLAGCGSLDPVKIAGKVTGKVAGGQVAKILPAPKAKTFIVEPKGGRFCRVLDAMGGPIILSPEDRLTDPTLRRVVNIDEHGEKHCGWVAK